ncbi:ATP-binding protein [Mongoliimonas terrestris]|uniref:ATP-binding protein n=1 Tax=Mongoliimonas terrestris TaxID=1709001 RepID=UPI000949927E|nr:ATP-binding protein [Mongoliimonas terrestris]
MSLVRRIWPASVAGQVLLLLVASVIAVHVVSLTVFLMVERSGPPASPLEHDLRLATHVRMLDAAAPADRASLLALVARSDPELRLEATDRAAPLDAPLGRMLAHWLPPGTRTWISDDGRYLIGLSDGSRLSAVAPLFSPPPSGPLQATAVFLGIGLMAFGAWAVLVVTRPLRHLARAVEAFGRDGAPVALAAQGPTEVKALIAAVNGMQVRIGSLLTDQARMLAAVSHDLKTPLTRLRLRAETVADRRTRAAMLADLEHMTVLTDAALAHLRGARSREDPVLVDLASVVHTLADQFADLGQAVEATGPTPCDVRLRPNDMQRAIRNLVENALRHAGKATIAYGPAPDGGVFVAVIDDGPGIPDADKARVLLPFERGDPARSPGGTAGLGLGLSVASMVAETHGGRLTLTDNRPSGLIATIDLPPETGAGAPTR